MSETGPLVGIVEDDFVLRNLAAQWIQEGGYAVLAAASGKEGLALIQSHPETALLFVDLKLPGNLDGSGLARAARTINPTLKVLFTSGHPDLMGESGPGTSMLPKPFRQPELLAEIAKLLG